MESQVANNLSLELENLGGKIVRDARRNALENKRTGKLDNSLRASHNIESIDSFSVTIEEKYYGEYLNRKTGFMDRAINSNLPRGLDKITDVIIEGLITDLING